MGEHLEVHHEVSRWVDLELRCDHTSHEPAARGLHRGFPDLGRLWLPQWTNADRCDRWFVRAVAVFRCSVAEAEVLPSTPFLLCGHARVVFANVDLYLCDARRRYHAEVQEARDSPCARHGGCATGDSSWGGGRSLFPPGPESRDFSRPD